MFFVVATVAKIQTKTVNLLVPWFDPLTIRHGGQIKRLHFYAGGKKSEKQPCKGYKVDGQILVGCLDCRAPLARGRESRVERVMLLPVDGLVSFSENELSSSWDPSELHRPEGET